MKSFLTRGVLLFFPVMLFIAGLMVFKMYAVIHEENNLFKINYNRQKLLDKKNIKNKIILIGGSNIIYGIDPYLLANKTKKSIVNLGHQRTDGVQNMLDLAKLVYSQGDLILISLEYGGETMGKSGRIIKYKIFDDPLYLLNGEVLLDFHKNVETGKHETGYYDENFYLVNLSKQQANIHKENFKIPGGYQFYYSDFDTDLITKFVDGGYSIMAFHPPLVREMLTPQNILQINSGKTNLLPVKYVTDQKNFVFNSDSIYDFRYHLNAAGRTERTNRLADNINLFLEKK